MPLPEVAAALGSQRKPAWGAPVVIWLVMLGTFPKLEMFMVVPPKNRFIEIAELPAFIFHPTDKLEFQILSFSLIGKQKYNNRTNHLK